MIAVNKLKGKIAEQGMNMTTFAKSIDLDYSSLYRRLEGQVSFTVSDVEKITKVLHLENEDIVSIFFAKEIA
jgi:betR domain|nr:MAG TPA: Regulatory protein-modification, helix-turn-helix, transcriptional regulato, DNA [Caudoviricetes sp.]